MLCKFNKRGQTVMPEYMVAFFLVIGAAVAIGLFAQRAYQARIRDARVYVANVATDACDANCMKAAEIPARDKIPAEYEPYYAQVDSKVTRANQDSTGLATSEIDKGQTTGLYHRKFKESTESQSASAQLPPNSAKEDLFNKK